MSVETVQAQMHAGPSSELDSPIWSVISFDRVEASDLDYVSASRLLAELENKKVAGLCIVTSNAAAWIKTAK